MTYDYDDDRPATDAEAHVEWRLNAGVPLGTPGCPWDACHDDPDGYGPAGLLVDPGVPEWVGAPVEFGEHYVPGALAMMLAAADDGDMPF